MIAVGLPDHYGALGVNRNADETTIKKSYRKNVLLWHPDKNPAEQRLAEEKIRLINNAYETLSNPQKRGQYDQQLVAFERRAQGVRMDTTRIEPRMSIPKEFMLCPMGYPDKFVRCVGSSLLVHSRDDSDLAHQEFFKEAKFSLWWLPQKNNMCHLRAQSSAGRGVRGGMNMTFALAGQVPTGEVALSPVEAPPSFFVAGASPDFQGAFRFESAYFPRCHIAFKPPTHLHIVNIQDDVGAVADFMLVDYTSMFRYMTLEEVLIPVIQGFGGDKVYVSVTALREDQSVRHYFQITLKKAVWSHEDFESYFEGHYQQWDYDPQHNRVRIRSKQARLMHSLTKSQNPMDVAAAVSSAGDVMSTLPVDVAEGVLSTLEQPLSGSENVTACVNYMTAQKLLLSALPDICRQAHLRQLLTIYMKVVNLGGSAATKDLVAQRDGAAKALASVLSDQIGANGVQQGEITWEVLKVLCAMPLDWGVCGEQLRGSVGPLLVDQPLPELVPLLHAAVKVSAQQVVELIAAAVQGQLSGATPALVAEALEAMAIGNLGLEAVPVELLKVIHEAPFELTASIIATLGEKQLESDALSMCASFLGKQQSKLGLLQSATLLRLIIAAAKSCIIASSLLDAVAAVARINLESWNMDDVSKLLLALAKVKVGKDSHEVAVLFSQAAEVVAPRLPALSSVQLIKVILAIGKEPACRSLLTSAAAEATKRMADLSRPQLLLLTQGLLPLGGDDHSLAKTLDFWTESLRNGEVIAGNHHDDGVSIRRQDAEHKAPLTADQLAKLVQILAGKVPSHAVFDVLSRQLAEGARYLTPAGYASLEVAFRDGSGPDFRGRSSLLRALQRNKEPSPRRSMDAPSTSRSRERPRHRRSISRRSRSRSFGRRKKRTK